MTESPSTPVGVVVVTGSCCFPGMQQHDRAAQEAIATASASCGIPVEVKVISATAALSGALPPQLLADLLARGQAGGLPLPAVLVAGKPIGTGTIRPDEVSVALSEAAHRHGSPESATDPA